MQTVGVRELKNRLTYYLGEIKNGENVVVTDRGNPVAIMHRLDKIEKDAGLDERLAVLAAQGHLHLPSAKGSGAAAFTPVVLEGEPLSESLIRDRR
jgi:antitoxin (DNA-binding transcriptional repressor) of toxin-antitoxin stability system